MGHGPRLLIVVYTVIHDATETTLLLLLLSRCRSSNSDTASYKIHIFTYVLPYRQLLLSLEVHTPESKSIHSTIAIHMQESPLTSGSW